MKRIFIIFTVIFFEFYVNAEEVKSKPSAAQTPAQTPSYDFIQKEAKPKTSYQFNPYEDLIASTIALAIGTVGYYSCKDSVVKLAYSGIESLAIVNMGKAVYNHYKPNLENDIYVLTKDLEKANSRLNPNEMISERLLAYMAKEQRAKRYALLAGSTLLTAQYFSNAFIGHPQKDLKRIYTFMGVVNTIIMSYSFLFRSKYEHFYYYELKNKPVANLDFKTVPYKNGALFLAELNF